MAKKKLTVNEARDELLIRMGLTLAVLQMNSHMEEADVFHAVKDFQRALEEKKNKSD